jgi:hypothetical protein
MLKAWIEYRGQREVVVIGSELDIDTEFVFYSPQEIDEFITSLVEKKVQIWGEGDLQWR